MLSSFMVIFVPWFVARQAHVVIIIIIIILFLFFWYAYGRHVCISYWPHYNKKVSSHTGEQDLLRFNEFISLVNKD
jgi:hypothetical protein